MPLDKHMWLMYNIYMIRTQIYIPEDEHSELMIVASQKKQPMAAVIRFFIKKGLKEEKTIDRSGKVALKKLLAIGATKGPNDLSANLDHYLYGGPKKHA